jgi:WD40 repeat protein
VNGWNEWPNAKANVDCVHLSDAYIVASDGSGSIYVLDTTTGVQVRHGLLGHLGSVDELYGHVNDDVRICTIQLSPTNMPGHDRLFVTGSCDCTARIWTLPPASPCCLHILRGHARPVVCTAWNAEMCGNLRF